MNSIIPTSFRKLMNGKETAEILSLMDGQVVRRLKVEGENVEIDALSVTVTVPLDTAIIYEAWTFDRGSLLFTAPGFPDNSAKICTELDNIRYPDGSVYVIGRP